MKAAVWHEPRVIKIEDLEIPEPQEGEVLVKMVAVGFVEKKLEWAKKLGVTNLVNAVKENPLERIQLNTMKGVDYVFECTGGANTIRLVTDIIRNGGTAIIVGMAPFGMGVSVDVVFLLFDKTLLAVGGSTKGAADIPRYVDLYVDGKIPLDRYGKHDL